jgi:hypothetical protein
MGLKSSGEHFTTITSPGIESYCATTERNNSATVWLCLVVPKDDTVKVASFDAPNDVGWRRTARAIVESIKVGRHVQWGGPTKILANRLKLQLEPTWTLDQKEVEPKEPSTLVAYRLLRRAEFGQVGPTCAMSVGWCSDDSAFRSELHGKLGGRMSCDGSHCDAQIEKVLEYSCLVTSCDGLASKPQELEVQRMLDSVERLPEPRGF